MSPELLSMLESQVEQAITAHREDALYSFRAYVAAMKAAQVGNALPVAPEEQTRLGTKADLRALLSIKSDRTIETMEHDGRIPADAVIRIGRKVRYDLAKIVEALRGGRSTAASWGARVGRSMRVINGGAK